MKLDSSDVNQSCIGDNWNPRNCPGEGYSQLSDWHRTRYDDGWEYGITRAQHNNPTMLNAFSRRSRREIITRLAVSNNSSRANYDAKSASSSWNISKPISISADWAIALNAEAPPSNGKYRDSTVVERLLLQFVASQPGTYI